MRKTLKLLAAIAPMAVALISNPSHAASFGDEVAACAAKSGLPPGSPDLNRVFTACEKEVSTHRDTAQSKENDVIAQIAQFEGCLKTASTSLDDFISPASDIARAAASSCEPKWRTILLSRNEPLEKINSYPSQTVLDVSLRTVLENRRAAALKKKR